MPRKNHRSGRKTRTRNLATDFENYGEFNPSVFDSPQTKENIEPYIPPTINEGTFKIPQYVPTRKPLLKPRAKPSLEFPAKIYAPFNPSACTPCKSISSNDIFKLIASEFPAPPPLLAPLPPSWDELQSSVLSSPKNIKPLISFRPVSINYPPPNEPIIPFNIIPSYRLPRK